MIHVPILVQSCISMYRYTIAVQYSLLQYIICTVENGCISVEKPVRTTTETSGVFYEPLLTEQDLSQHVLLGHRR